MTDRQQALLAYLRVISPKIRGAKSFDELIKRVVSCMGEDLSAVAGGFAEAAVNSLRGSVEFQAHQLVGSLGKSAAEWFAGLSKKR